MKYGVLLVIVLLAAVPAAAQERPVQLAGPADDIFVHGGAQVEVVYSLTSSDLHQAYHVTLRVDTPSDGNWQASMVPAQTVLGPGDQRDIRLVIEAADRPAPRSPVMVVHATAVGADFTTIVLSEEIQVRTGRTSRSLVLGHLQRGGGPTAFDRLLATRFGAR